MTKTYVEGDTAQCKNCPETITYLRDRLLPGDESLSWFHTRIRDWPEKNTVMKVMHCPRPHKAAIAEPA